MYTCTAAFLSIVSDAVFYVVRSAGSDWLVQELSLELSSARNAWIAPRQACSLRPRRIYGGTYY